MTLLSTATALFERVPLPDGASRVAIERLVGRTAARLRRQASPEHDRVFAAAMPAFPIAEHPEDANRQHYELPPEFFALLLGPHRKYSCCYYSTPETSLAEAEATALALSADHADLQDGQEILELGCGWGSFSLWMARRLPAARITAVSNSTPQRLAIEAIARAEGLTNLTVVTADMNDFAPTGRFDRIVSVEMFEHMANWQALLQRARGWLRPEGRLFLHVFTHRDTPYRFHLDDKEDWIAQHFFTGGIMPSHGLIGCFPDLFSVEQDWRWSGTHYARTARDWLALYEANAKEIDGILRQVYGGKAALWRRRWRLFLLATEGLFGHEGGEVWGVSHYRLAPA